MKILIVEDDPGTRKYMVKAAQTLGHEVQEAEDGEAGCKAFDKFEPDIVLSDIQMPRADGLELLERLRRKSDDAIIIMTTAMDSAEYTVKALQLHANDYLVKPVQFSVLKAALAKYSEILNSRTKDQEVLGLFEKRYYRLKLPNQPELVSRIADRLLAETVNSIARKERMGVRLGLTELLSNAIEHGTLGITYEEKSKALEAGGSAWRNLVNDRLHSEPFCNRQTIVEFEMNDQGCEWYIKDDGEGFDWNNLPDPLDPENLLCEHGRGIMLAQLQFDEFEFSGNGNEVRMKKNCCR
ncbi:MAG TPA: response regulator [Candidatus Rifleibacterium sp.]|nr:response regulator [Candidatus Rifleibacterium sp.]HPT45935.1 response regulator [Candidatus Rifleibacterium sp.]